MAAETQLLFDLTQKVTKKIKTEKSFRAAGKTPWPAFLSCLYPLWIVNLIYLNFFIIVSQQISFG
jgi:hypothetical protein